ncbi:hypothetical protein PAJ_p0197 (plasmid) [Pantoea ananatis AJ13355]|uniref:Uncharacterized protein n=1 Tax=Pantoea ananatis (strain AJ13355) TaxID=932677 RepID=A0A0H3L4B2_PANAA|nr:hypothetical protein PAJ_p0197 [Pantoea ananatis AJ13355]
MSVSGSEQSLQPFLCGCSEDSETLCESLALCTRLVISYSIRGAAERITLSLALSCSRIACSLGWSIKTFNVTYGHDRLSGCRFLRSFAVRNKRKSSVATAAW